MARIGRRTVIAGAAGLGALGIAGRFLDDGPTPGALGGADFARGHRLRDGGFPAPVIDEYTNILIAGGGVAGLAAGWMLAEAGFTEFQLLELENATGGNARAGHNAISAYPLGAHYLPIPNREARALRHMLNRFGMIIGLVTTGGLDVLILNRAAAAHHVADEAFREVQARLVQVSRARAVAGAEFEPLPLVIEESNSPIVVAREMDETATHRENALQKDTMDVIQRRAMKQKCWRLRNEAKDDAEPGTALFQCCHGG